MVRLFLFLLSLLILRIECLDLLGLSVSVPALEKDGAVTNLLSGGGSKPSENINKNDNSKPTPEKICAESASKINGGQAVCGGTLLFEDHFHTGQLNSSKWVKQQYIPYYPDYEFVTYEKRAQNCYINDGNLYLKATLRENPHITKLDLSNGCTGQNCSVSTVATIVSPIIAGKIKSKFSFLYGKVEIRAQLPKGDWIFPQVNLEPKGYAYGPGYRSGRLWVAYARGNADLKREESQEQIGNSVLYSGAVLAEEEPARIYATQKIIREEGWVKSWHVYSLIWAPDGITVLVDGIEQGFISPPFTHAGSPFTHLWTADMAPFDQEFVVSLGVAAGGFTDFPEGSTSNGNKKPWKKTNARASLLFYNTKDQWFPTWSGDNSALKIDYVKIWSL